jgi:hypothetical protein
MTTMKQLFYILILFGLIGCNQENSKQIKKITQKKSSDSNFDTISSKNRIDSKKTTLLTQQTQESNTELSLSGFENAKSFKLTDTIIADFNGDGVLDKAIIKKENKTSGIIIKHGTTNEVVKIGFGKRFSTWTDFDCKWVDYWGLVKDKETVETTFDDAGDVLGVKNIKLNNPSIVLGQNEIGGGLITYLNGKYVWIHQTC